MESEEFTISPAGLGFPQVTDQEILLGGDAVENATRITRILSGRESGAARDMIMLNAAAALHLAGIGVTLHDALHLASESIDAGKALRSLELLRSASVSSVSEHV
jgi:anthranilate phosphoribosyltransferase